MVFESFFSDWDGDGMTDETSETTYDLDGNVIGSYSNSNGYISEYEYDSDGNMIFEKFLLQTGIKMVLQTV